MPDPRPARARRVAGGTAPGPKVLGGIGEVRHLRVVDRREAIRRALEQAEPGDLVLLAGKGHERYQVVGTEKRPFDERVIVREELAAPPAGGGA